MDDNGRQVMRNTHQFFWPDELKSTGEITYIPNNCSNTTEHQ